MVFKSFELLDGFKFLIYIEGMDVEKKLKSVAHEVFGGGLCSFVSANEHFGSTVEGHRAAIRHSIKDDLIGVVDLRSIESILDLSRPPSVSGLSISISHCRGIGGYVISGDQVNIGFDVEEERRINQKILDRISHPEDHPLGQYTWVAKESAAKALSKKQGEIPSLPQIQIVFDSGSELEQVKKYSFSHSSITGRGFALSIDSHLFAVSIIDERKPVNFS